MQPAQRIFPLESLCALLLRIKTMSLRSKTLRTMEVQHQLHLAHHLLLLLLPHNPFKLKHLQHLHVPLEQLQLANKSLAIEFSQVQWLRDSLSSKSFVLKDAEVDFLVH
jgi:hypothetical protein